MTKHIEDIEHLEAYLADKYDVFVTFAPGEINACSEIDKIITINSRQHPKNRLYSLLHEAGHIILHEDYEYSKMFPKIVYQPFKRRVSQLSAVDVIRNEVLAWEVGHELADHLGIDINENKWNNIRKKCLYEYCKWAVGEM